MKTKFTLLSLMLFFSINSFSQSWTGSSGKLYANPTSTKVGIGTTSPASVLHIKNPSGFNPGTSTYSHIKIEDYQYNMLYTALEFTTYAAQGVLKLSNNSGNTTEIGAYNSYFDGPVSVNGKVKTKEVEVTLSGWSDFVFEQNYNLRTLKEVESYINENKHLPDVPSEEEVIENGVNLGEMDAILLQKIEELTLYVIEQEKRITDLENINR